MSVDNHEQLLASLVSGTRFTEVRWVATTGSTNADLMATAIGSDGAAVTDRVLVTDFQSVGRGRKQRVWEAPPGSSLLMSLLVRTDDAATDGHRWTTAMGVAAAGACAEVAAVDVQIKWPNDLVVNDRKLAGVLAESVLAGNQLAAVVVGIGINIRDVDLPPEIAARSTSLDAERRAVSETAEQLDRVDLAASILTRFDEWCDAAPQDLHHEMLRHSATVGRQVRVDLPDRSVVGVASEVAPDGRLVVTAADGTEHRWSAGDVTHLRTPDDPGPDSSAVVGNK